MKLGDKDEILVSGQIFSWDIGTGRSKLPRRCATGGFTPGSGRSECVGNVADRGAIKNLIVLGSGHKVSPEPIENAIAKLLPEAQQVVVVGNGRGYLSALVTGSVTAEKVQAALDAVNPELPHYKQVRAFRVIQKHFRLRMDC